MTTSTLRGRAPSGVPQYALDYAPIIFLHSKDPYRPSDIAATLEHTTPQVNYAVVSDVPSPLTLDNLDKLNSRGGSNVHLTSKDDITTDPAWLKGVAPDADGKINGAITAAIIVRDHGNGTVDVFYIYFYVFNSGPQILGRHQFGLHVGDWEHNMIRFKDGVPQAVWCSQHSNGQAFEFGALEKYKGGKRPVVYSSHGSHANYATAGTHDYTLQFIHLPFPFIVYDRTDAGVPWDPTLNAYYYSYSAADSKFKAYDDTTPTAWLYFDGKWGDQQYPDNDRRQKRFLSFRKYGGGPTGPKDKRLNRKNVCPNDDKPCRLRRNLRRL